MNSVHFCENTEIVCKGKKKLKIKGLKNEKIKKNS